MGIDTSAITPGPAGGYPFTSASTQPGGFAIPLRTTVVEGLNPGNNFSTGDTGVTLNGNYITVNKTGLYRLDIDFAVLVNVGPPTPPPFTAGNWIQLSLVDKAFPSFSSPPAVDCGAAVLTTATTPLATIYSGFAAATGSMVARLTQGEQLHLMIYMPYDVGEIALTSALCIQRIDT